jgi:hypothetical protein
MERTGGSGEDNKKKVLLCSVGVERGGQEWRRLAGYLKRYSSITGTRS